jgi:hypothetical protein
MQERWKYLAKPDKECQAFFTREKYDICSYCNMEEIYEHDGLYVRDNSGKDPDATRDGPLRVDKDAGIFLTVSETGEFRCALRVCVERETDDRDRWATVWITPKTAVYLLEEHGMKTRGSGSRVQTIHYLLENSKVEDSLTSFDCTEIED